VPSGRDEWLVHYDDVTLTLTRAAYRALRKAADDPDAAARLADRYRLEAGMTTDSQPHGWEFGETN